MYTGRCFSACTQWFHCIVPLQFCARCSTDLLLGTGLTCLLQATCLRRPFSTHSRVTASCGTVFSSALVLGLVFKGPPWLPLLPLHMFCKISFIPCHSCAAPVQPLILIQLHTHGPSLCLGCVPLSDSQQKSNLGLSFGKTLRKNYC